MIVYRLEHEASHAGPYNGPEKLPSGLLFDMHERDVHRDGGDHWSTHPLPDIDLGKGWKKTEGLIFGFETMEQLLRWFGPSTRGPLERHGFGVATYDVREDGLVKGSRQLAFDRRASVRVSFDKKIEIRSTLVDRQMELI